MIRALGRATILSRCLSIARITLTEKSLQKLTEKCSPGEFLRIAVDGGGCSGFQYLFEMDSDLQTDDLTVMKDGVVRVAVDSESIKYIEGSTLDYQDEMIRSAFTIVKNPNANEQGCSCGASFNLDPSVLSKLG